MFCENRLKNKEKTKVKTETEQPLIHNVDTVYIETSHTLFDDEADVLLWSSTFPSAPVVHDCLDDDAHPIPNPNSIVVDSRNHLVTSGLCN